MRSILWRVAAMLAASLTVVLIQPISELRQAAAAKLRIDAAPRPNIVFIMADDIGWGDFQCYNPQGKIPTPNIDRLAREGMRFTNAHTPAALCAPTRYAVATGNYPWRGPLPNGTWAWNNGSAFLPEQKTIGKILSEAGYRTGLFGKLHYGGKFEAKPDGRPDFTKPMTVGPKEWGFDYSYVLLGGHQSPPYCFFENGEVEKGRGAEMTPLAPGPLNGGVVPAQGPGLPDYDSRQVGEKLVHKTVAFIDETLAKAKADGKPQPFYVHLSTDGAHGPYTPPDTIDGTAVKGESKMTQHTDMVHEVDVVVGKITAALEERGLLDNTLIVVTSDNGGLPFERDLGHDAVGGLHCRKSLMWEGGHRVPFIVHWGRGAADNSKVPPGTVRSQVVGTLDIDATFADLAGATPGADQLLDSASLVPVLVGKADDNTPIRKVLLVQSSPGRDAFTEVMNPAADAARRQNQAAANKAQVPAKKAQAAAKKAQAAAKKAAARKAQAALEKEQASLPSQGIAHAILQGDWKLVFDIGTDKPVALYNLATDLAETKNLVAESDQADRVKTMDAAYREIRASKRSTPALGQ